MAYVSGGQGLWSTVDDYLAFARMFVGAGAVAFGSCGPKRWRS